MSSSSSSSPLQILMYSTFGVFLILTFLAGHYSSPHSFHTTVGSNDSNAVSNSLDNFLRGNEKTTAHEHIWGKPIQRPSDWETWGFYDIHRGFNCGQHARDQNKPLPDMDYWNYYRETFQKVVGPSKAFDDPVLPTEGYTLPDGYKQPYYAKRSPGKGRGLFASRDIKKGEVVHDGTNSDTQISGEDYRRFLFSLPQKMACDSTEWSWTQQLKPKGPYVVMTAFNISVLMNGSDKPNAMPKDSYSSRFLATRDIKKGEEILTDYHVYPTRYDKVGM